MISTTTQYKSAIKKNRVFSHELSITYPDGTQSTIDESKLFQFTITENTSNENSFDIGAAVAKQLTFKLDNTAGTFTKDFSDARISARVGLALSGSTEWLNKGTYTAEPGKTTGDTITVSTFDDMVKFDQPYSLSNLTYPATLGDIVRDACNVCGVPMDASIATFDKSTLTVKERPDGPSITFRQIIGWVAQISCKFAKINAAGKLTFSWYNKTLLNSATVATSTSAAHIDAYKQGSTINTGDVTITAVRVTDTAGTTYQSGSDGYALDISGNKLIQEGSGETVAAWIASKVVGLTVRPLKVITQPDPALEAGDVVTVTDRKGNFYKTLATGVQYSAGGTMTVTSAAETPQRRAATRYSSATKVYKDLEKQMRKDKTAWETALEALEKAMESKKGLFPIIKTKPDGSKLYYLGDRPTLEESEVVFALNAEGWAISTDGAKTWNAGMTVDGTMITKILNTIGINAGWIRTGALTVADTEGHETLYVNTETGEIRMAPTTFKLSGKTVAEIADANLQAFVKDVYEKDLEAVQNQIDGQIEIHYYPHVPTASNKPASAWTTEKAKVDHTGDLFYNTTTGYAYRYKKTFGGVKVKFSDQCRTESTTYDWVQIFYQIGDKVYALPKLGGTSIAGAEVFVPAHDFWLHWRTDGSQDNYYGFAIASIEAATGENSGEIATLPTPKETAELSGATYPESAHNGYGNGVSKLWTYHSGTTTADTYEWIRVKDSDISAAEAAAQGAQETADNKRRVFLETPTPPYDAGDLWTQGTAGDIMVCIRSRASGAYTSTDWQKSNKYTDDTNANLALERIESMKTLSVIMSNEYQGIATDSAGNYSTFPTVATAISVYLGTVDVTADCTYTTTASAGVTGSWNATTKTYTVTALTADNGYVDIEATHKTFSLKGKKRFTISKVKAGSQGVQGPPGANGTTTYTWLKYADTPTSGMSDSPDGKSYIGLAYNKTTATESTRYSDYTWSLIKGEKGDTGVQGPPGPDGTKYYTWIKYATSSSGANMSDSPTGKTYIGIAYNKTTATESTNASDYTWSLIKGDKGDQGDKGATGDPGTDGGTWTIEVSSNTVKRGEDGVLKPSSLTASAYFQSGNSAARSAYTGRLYCYTSTNGTTWTQKSTVSSGTSITVDISTLASTVYWLKFTLCAAGTTTVIDQQTVQILDDISSLTGAIMLQKLSGGWQGIYQDSKGNYYIDASYIQAGTLSAKYIDGKNLTVKNGNKTTLAIDENGNVSIDATSLSISGSAAATQGYADSAASTAASSAAAEALKNAKSYADGKSENLLMGPDLSADSVESYWNVNGTLSRGYSDPDGGSKAVRLYCTQEDSFVSARYDTNNPVVTAGPYEVRVWLRSNTTKTISISFNRVQYSCKLTTKWQQFIFPVNVTTPETGYENFTIGGFGTASSGYVFIYNPEVRYSYTPESIFNLLTDNGSRQGIFMKDGNLYVNMTYLSGGTAKLGGNGNGNGQLQVLNATGTEIVKLDNTGISVTKGSINLGSGKFKVDTNGKMEATSGSIGGWLLASNKIYDGFWDAFPGYGICLHSGEGLYLGRGLISGQGGDMRISGPLTIYARSNTSIKGYNNTANKFMIYGLPTVSSGGHLVFNSDGAEVAYLSSSSKRYKDHVDDLDTTEAEKLLKLPVVRFKYKDGYLDAGDRLVGKAIPGFYAEDMAEIYPTACQYNAEGTPEDWNYRTLIPLMLKLIQNLYERLEK